MNRHGWRLYPRCRFIPSPVGRGLEPGHDRVGVEAGSEPGAAQVAGRSEVLKLSSNENPFGPSPKARDAVIRAAHVMHRYPLTDRAALRRAIGEVHRLDPDRIICGVGSDEIIHFLCQAYGARGPRSCSPNMVS